MRNAPAAMSERGRRTSRCMAHKSGNGTAVKNGRRCAKPRHLDCRRLRKGTAKGGTPTADKPPRAQHSESLHTRLPQSLSSNGIGPGAAPWRRWRAPGVHRAGPIGEASRATAPREKAATSPRHGPKRQGTASGATRRGALTSACRQRPRKRANTGRASRACPGHGVQWGSPRRPQSGPCAAREMGDARRAPAEARPWRHAGRILVAAPVTTSSTPIRASDARSARQPREPCSEESQWVATGQQGGSPRMDARTHASTHAERLACMQHIRAYTSKTRWMLIADVPSNCWQTWRRAKHAQHPGTHRSPAYTLCVPSPCFGPHLAQSGGAIWESARLGLSQEMPREAANVWRGGPLGHFCRKWRPELGCGRDAGPRARPFVRKPV